MRASADAVRTEPGRHGMYVGAWALALTAAIGVRLWNALAGPLMWGYDSWAHVAYVIFLDIYRAVPWADQGWSYFHPPLHYALGLLLAQFGSGEVLMRGLSLLGSTMSLLTATLAAVLVRRIMPRPRWLTLVAFGAIAFLPAQLFMSPMPGNEMTVTFLASAAMVWFILGDGNASPSWRHDATTGVLLGLALLAKFNAAIALLAIVVTLGVRALAAPREAGRIALRIALISGVAFAISGPYFARNWVSLRNPIAMSRPYALVSEVESGQPPGFRTLHDYFYVSPRMFVDANPQSPHMLHSVWGTVYLNFWADTFRDSDRGRALDAELAQRSSTQLMAVAGLLPTGLAVAGMLLCLGDVRRHRRSDAALPLAILTAGALAAFAGFAWVAPSWPSLKSSYLMILAVPFAVFLTRTVESLANRLPLRATLGLVLALAAIAAGACAVAIPGVGLPRRADSPAAGPVHFYFAEYDQARRVFGHYSQSPQPLIFLDALAGVDLAAGNPARAHALYGRALSISRSLGIDAPYRTGRLAVALALDGKLDEALDRFDEELEEQSLPALLANRGAVRALAGDRAGAMVDLRAATESAPEMVPAWLNLAALQHGEGFPEDARRSRENASRVACEGPRGHPYGVGTGEVLQWGVGARWLLLLDGSQLSLALPAFYHDACVALARS
jgi:hypothetical protein